VRARKTNDMITKDLINFLFGMKRGFAFGIMNYAGNTALNGVVCLANCKSEARPDPTIRRFCYADWARSYAPLTLAVWINA
jgi:hypothetical protein